MKYDTLILSGGSVKGYAFIGSFKYLLDNKIIEIHKLKHIIGASVGAMMAIPLLLNVSIELFYKIIIQTNIKLYDKDDFKIANLINDFGIFDNTSIETYVSTFCRHILKVENITLKELYELSKIKFTVKVSNVTKNKVEYMNYLNYPDIDLVTLIKMTTSIPLVFKPVLYNGCLYSDGAVGGGLPIEYNKSKKYLGIVLYPLERKSKEHLNILDFMNNLFHLHHCENDYNNYKKYKNIIFIDVNASFKIDITEEEKIKFFKEGYLQTKKFFTDSSQHS